MREIEQLRRQIELLEGIDALGLSREQMEKIVKLAERARADREALLKENADDIADVKKELEALRDAVAAGDGGSRRALDEIQQRMGETMRSFYEINALLARELEELLDKKHWEAALKIGRHDPSRHLREEFGRMIDRLREEPEMPESLTDILYERLDEMAEHLGLDRADIPDESGRIAEQMDAAIDLPGDEYEKRRDEILRAIVEEGALGAALKKREPPAPQGPDPRLAEFLTDPAVIGALKKRLEG
jgi:hypothetical protein